MRSRQPTDMPIPPGLAWVMRTDPTVMVLGLETALGEEVRLHVGSEPPEEAPWAVILCLNEEEDLARELARAGELAPGARLLVFAPRIGPALARAALRGGARGLLHPGMSPGQIVRALSLVREGEVAAPRRLVRELVAVEGPAYSAALSARQRDVLELAVKGLPNARIARQLFVSESTVKKHLRAAYRTLGVKNRLGAAKRMSNGAREP